MPSIDKLHLNELINQALKENAISLSFNISSYPIMKIRDNLKILEDAPILTKEFLETIMDSILNDTQKEILKKEKELTMGYDWSNDVRLIVNFFYQRGSLSITIKIVPAVFRDITELNLPNVVNDIVKMKSGLIIICGPVSSGRTTTISSILEYLNKNTDNRIVTIECPIERQFINKKSIIQQREIGRDVDSIADGLNDVIDEDVNIVYVAKISSKEDVKAMLQVANSGKLVFVIMDLDSIVSVLNQIYGSFELSEKDWARSLLVESLRVIINQRLIPRSGGGEILASEVFTMTSTSYAMVKSGNFDQIKSIMQTSRQDNMQDLDTVLKTMVQNGIIELENAKKYSNNPEVFK
ncbi:MAG: ATPase, T2SS/T4P/T4SS family [Patescibacteria group bacterium]|nr:ATPase, T2SS/T4P/T4SS family [Patescibacteria group bacterium]MDD4304214.1 ATPase, T2SS/T4P/T4SS family [Patescibacteria group bacterium]MDD4695247.1 ATPase, T2SS/T4P/T4SS family [Patescibacteria group bacterium]